MSVATTETPNETETPAEDVPRSKMLASIPGRETLEAWAAKVSKPVTEYAAGVVNLTTLVKEIAKVNVDFRLTLLVRQVIFAGDADPDNAEGTKRYKNNAASRAAVDKGDLTMEYVIDVDGRSATYRGWWNDHVRDIVRGTKGLTEQDANLALKRVQNHVQDETARRMKGNKSLRRAAFLLNLDELDFTTGAVANERNGNAKDEDAVAEQPVRFEEPAKDDDGNPTGETNTRTTRISDAPLRAVAEGIVQYGLRIASSVLTDSDEWKNLPAKEKEIIAKHIERTRKMLDVSYRVMNSEPVKDEEKDAILSTVAPK